METMLERCRRLQLNLAEMDDEELYGQGADIMRADLLASYDKLTKEEQEAFDDWVADLIYEKLGYMI